MVTFGPGSTIQEQKISIPLITDDLNEATEGFFVVIIKDAIIGSRRENVKMDREGVALVKIIDDDCKSGHSVASCDR